MDGSSFRESYMLGRALGGHHNKRKKTSDARRIGSFKGDLSGDATLTWDAQVKVSQRLGVHELHHTSGLLVDLCVDENGW
jgi:hypothetical protein